jgi:hypothetical protein
MSALLDDQNVANSLYCQYWNFVDAVTCSDSHKQTCGKSCACGIACQDWLSNIGSTQRLLALMTWIDGIKVRLYQNESPLMIIYCVNYWSQLRVWQTRMQDVK